MGGLPPSAFVLAAAPATGKDGFAASPFTGSPASSDASPAGSVTGGGGPCHTQPKVTR